MKQTILAVDDVVENLDVLEELLQDYTVIDATNGQDAIALAKQEDIDLILLDIMMPKMDGYEVCKRLKEDEQTKDIPVIFITAKVDEQSIEKAYEIGGSDYITKPFLPKELLARIKKELHIQDLIHKLEYLATVDALTKLYNRHFFYDSAKNIIAYAKRYDNNLSIIMLDIDHFKVVNDTYGHAVGDIVLKELAALMRSIQRKSDIIVRLGGEEFALLLPDTNLEEAKKVAQKLRITVQNNKINLQDGQELQFTISLGVGIVDIKNEQEIEHALSRADKALYKAKNSGRNRVC